MIDFYAAKTKRNDGVSRFFADVVFLLDEKVTRSNTEVDEHFGLPETSSTRDLVEGNLDTSEGLGYSLGLERKMAMLEGGLAYAHSAPTATRTVRSLQMLKPSREVAMNTFKYTMAFIAVLMMLVLAQLVTKILNLY